MSEQKTVTLSYQEHERLLAIDKELTKLKEALNDEDSFITKSLEVEVGIFQYTLRCMQTKSTTFSIVKSGVFSDEINKALKKLQEKNDQFEKIVESAETNINRQYQELEAKKLEALQEVFDSMYKGLPWYVKLFYKKQDPKYFI